MTLESVPGMENVFFITEGMKSLQSIAGFSLRTFLLCPFKVKDEGN